jgi:hypothetical protein
MAPFFVTSLCDILYELLEPHGIRGGHFVLETLALQAGTI